MLIIQKKWSNSASGIPAGRGRVCLLLYRLSWNLGAGRVCLLLYRLSWNLGAGAGLLVAI